MADDLPAAIGPYPVLRRLGHGGMAEVLLARSLGASGFERLVAIKRPLPAFAGDGELERLLIAEARVGARIAHRNLVAVHGLGLHEGTYYVVMDYVEGADLDTLRRRHAAVPALVVHLVAEVLLGLHHLHALPDDAGRPLGLVHRDVSPSNVLVSRGGEVKLADYGIAKATYLAGDTQANVRRGKYAYMSPEQVAGRPLDGRSDQFGVGVMLVELLTGRRPFDGQGDGPAAVLDRIRRAEPPDLSALPPALIPVAERCLRAQPEERHPDALAMREALLDAMPAAARLGPPEVAAWEAVAIEPEGDASGRPRTSTVRTTADEPD
ncbi:serine/threonine-protein kinase [Paraliomyxa miuraensis]|uniref:serine/threonine-protein kinase n=1 Tax=Paraliomyxa miuraensis TaxID=376150 RepID=UPI0022547900|nr:serine/threonine-protein kinase [Paraliomyxa miuraensis]MCX4245363.1 serine/threonine protein kinase [Paraliomyxa miuraensis]